MLPWRRLLGLCGWTFVCGIPQLACHAREAESPPYKIVQIIQDTTLDGPLDQFSERLGGLLGIEEANVLGGFFGQSFELVTEFVQNHNEASTVMNRHIEDTRTIAFIANADTPTTEILSELAQQSSTLLFNCSNPSDHLRNDRCERILFHVTPSESMYVHALGRWLVEAKKHKSWYIVYSSDAVQSRCRKTLHAYLEDIEGISIQSARISLEGNTLKKQLDTIVKSKPDIVFLCLNDEELERLLNEHSQADLKLPLAGAFLPPDALWKNGGRQLEEGIWPVAWNHKLFRYSARDLNSRFKKKFERPMDSLAWANWAAVKMIAEAVIRSGSTDAKVLIDYLEGEQSFDGHKGTALSFRHWNHQLRQPVYLMRAGDNSSDDAWNYFDVLTPMPYPVQSATQELLDTLGVSEEDCSCQFEGTL